jgi:hypothetical protein
LQHAAHSPATAVVRNKPMHSPSLVQRVTRSPAACTLQLPAADSPVSPCIQR